MAARIPVWGAGIRLLHWLLVSAIVVAWIFSSDARTNWHQIAGYTVAATLLLRLGWGTVVGPRSARLSRCLRAPLQLPEYLRRMRTGRDRRFLGHNPLGGMMVLALLAAVASTCFTGWLFTTDRFWGYAWLSTLHHTLAWGVVVLSGLHVAGVVVTSVRHRENLPLSMITGDKRRHVRR